MTNTSAESAARSAQSGAADVRRKVGPPGLIGKGLLYTSLGFIAIQVALGDSSSGEASQNGAIERVAQAPFGKFLLIALAVGLVALVIWKAMQAIAGDPIDDETKDRVKNGVKAAFYAGSAITAVSVLIANWSSSGSGSSGSGGDSKQQATATVLGWPGGKFIVMIGGIAVVGYGAYEFYKNVVNKEFQERLEGSTPDGVKTLGIVGFGGRAVLIVAIGIFLFFAGLNHDPDQAQGLSGVLADLAGNSLGRIAIWVIAVGVLAYGVFAFVESKYRRAY